MAKRFLLRFRFNQQRLACSSGSLASDRRASFTYRTPGGQLIASQIHLNHIPAC
jgi:hypothetical protein